MDIVYIRELEIETIIGIYDWEREQRQVVSLDLEMGTDISLAASSENIENTLYYKAVASLGAQCLCWDLQSQSST